VLASAVGKEADSSHVRQAFRAALRKAEGIDAADWTPRELPHSFVSLLSDSTAAMEEVCRKQIRPVIQTGAVAMDRIFARSKTVDTHFDTQHESGP
jgi:hypothetical protein